MRMRNVAVALAGLLAAVGLWFGWPGSYSLALLATFLFALVWGAQAVIGLAFALLVLAVGHAGVRGALAVYQAGGMVVAGLLGVWIGVRIGAVEYRQQQLRDNLRAMLRASGRAGSHEDPDELLIDLPDLFSKEFNRKVCVFEMEGTGPQLLSGACSLDPDAGLLASVIERKQPQYRPAAGRGLSLLVLPMCERYAVWMESARPLDEDERRLGQAFAEVVCLIRRRLEENAEARRFGQMMAAMASSSELEAALQKVLAQILPSLDATSGVVMIFRMGRFEPLAMFGNIPPAEEALLLAGLPAGWGGIWRSYISSQPLYVDDYGEFDLQVPEVYEAGIRSLAFVPVSGERRARIVLVIQDEKVRSWSERERDFLALAARGVGLMAEQFLVRERLDALLKLEREVLGLLMDEAYETLMHYAVRLVPGAEAGSLLMRNSVGDYYYAAALGYDLEGLRELSYTLSDLRDEWYLAGVERWERGEARVVSIAGEDIAAMSHKTAPSELIDVAGRAPEIAANLCIPIVYQGEVLAVMNLDSFSDAEAFDDDSIEVARIFAQQTALLLHEQHYRELLERAAHTDPLTGLPNRRAFDEDYAEFWGGASRYAYPLAVLEIDLTGFKEVNDRFGHATGDQVLHRVAEILSTFSRNGDRVYRWGGDEFAALLPHTNLAGAVQAARRYAAAIEKVCLEGHCIRANLGAAACPEDTGDPEELLKLADARMYQAKAAGIVIEPRL